MERIIQLCNLTIARLWLALLDKNIIYYHLNQVLRHLRNRSQTKIPVTICTRIILGLYWDYTGDLTGDLTGDYTCHYTGFLGNTFKYGG